MARQPDRSRAVPVLIALCAAAPFIVGTSLLAPVVLMYRDEGSTLTAAEAAAWVQDARAAAVTLQEVNGYRALGIHGEFRGQTAVSAAEEILGGRVTLPPYGVATVSWPFDPEDLVQGPPTMQLMLASLVVGDILLEAYGYTADDRYLDAARELTLAVVAHERALWLPEGFIWNDHAVALRSQFVTRLLTVLAGRDDPELEDIRVLLRSLERSARLLSKERYFTYQGNHGLMQSLAFMHMAVVAPSLPAVEAGLDEVIARTDRQLRYLVTGDGVVTEHSAGYQGLNLELVALALRYVSILGRPVPDHWVQRYQRGLAFYRHMRRPDGTIPRHGDTEGRREGELEAVRSETDGDFVLRDLSFSPPRDGVWLSEDFGYWSEWRGGTHLFAAWADFGPRSHKHADDLSLEFWWHGEEWWTAGGYWPYGGELRERGIGWGGSNAPHAPGEPADVARSAELRAWYADSTATVLHLNRRSETGFEVNRTVVRLFADTWVVVDAPAAEGAARTVWPTMSSVERSGAEDPSGTFFLSSTKTDARLVGQPLVGPGATGEWVYGSERPFAGWVYEDGRVSRSHALVLEAPARSWAGLAWRADGDADAGEPVVVALRWQTPEQWSIDVGTTEGPVTLTRAQDGLELRTPTSSASMTLRAPSPLEELARAEAAYEEMRTSITPFSDHLYWRMRMLRLATIAGTAQLVALLVAAGRLRRHASYSGPALALILIAHIGFGFWLHWVYFAA